MRSFLRVGVAPSWSWICETMRDGHLALAATLLEAGVERNIFTMAAMGDLAGLTRRLGRVPSDARLAMGMEPTCHEVTPLHVACASDWRSHGQDRMGLQVEVGEALREHGADLNASASYRGLDEVTPVFCACWSSGNLALVRWLLDHGAFLNGGELMAALGHFQRHHKAAYDIAETLLASGLPVDGGVRGGRTPLQAFAHQAAHKTVSWLIAHGADVNARGPGGRTAAHFAAERNTAVTTLAILVASGADLATRDEDGHTPLDIAKLNGKSHLVDWMRKSTRAKKP
jgi:ankyrin repeat protein